MQLLVLLLKRPLRLLLGGRLLVKCSPGGTARPNMRCRMIPSGLRLMLLPLLLELLLPGMRINEA